MSVIARRATPKNLFGVPKRSAAISEAGYNTVPDVGRPMRVPLFARKLKRRLLGTGVKPYAPTFAGHDLVMALRAHLEPGGRSTDPRDESGRVALPTCIDDLVTHFSQPRTPSFFADAGTLAEKVRDVASSRPQWRERLVEAAANDLNRGLKIYSMTGPVLRPGYPWAGMPVEPNGDDLYSIRPHRFGFAPRHALAVLYGSEPAKALADVLEDWMAFTASGRSEFPYVSSLVVIQRLVALSWTQAFVLALPSGDDPTVQRLHADILRIMFADICFLMPRFGKTAPNNHLLADRFASWYIRLLFPEFVAGPADLDVHETAWLAELERQVYPDGTSFEHSLHYHEFACEMAVAYVLLCRRNSRAIPWAALEQVERMLGFQVGLAGPDSITIPFGDAIEDPLFNLDTAEAWGTAGLRELYRALFRPELTPASPTIPSVERAFWLLGGALAPSRATALHRKCAPCVWPNGGYGVFSDASASARLIFRTGPARHYGLVGGHMHADLLSVCVTRGDRPMLVESGTFTYRWMASDTGAARAYFSGPAAHNGLALDAIDPVGVVRGHFRGRDVSVRVSTTRCLPGDRLCWMEGEIFGDPPYAGYRRGVVHIPGAYWIIYDILPAKIGGHAATFGFQAAAGVRATCDEAKIASFEAESGMLWLASGPGLDGPRIVCGASDPPGGWVAPAYGERTPAPQLRYGVAHGTRATAFALGTGPGVARPVAVHALRTGLAVEVEGREQCDLLVLATHDEAIDVRVAGGVAKAAAVWVRRRNSRAESMRCLSFQGGEPRRQETSSGLSRTRFDAMFPTDGDVREIECLDPEALSVSLSGRAWC